MDTEFIIQSYVSSKLKGLNILHHADQNSLARTKVMGGKAKASGMCAGWPDMCVVVYYAVYWFEFKSAYGYLSTEQKKVHEKLQKLGQKVYVIKEKTKEEAWTKVREHLNI